MKKGFLKALLWCSFFILTAQENISLESVISAELADELRSKGRLQSIAYKKENYELALMPSTRLSAEISKVWTSEKEPVFIAETLYLIEKDTNATSQVAIERVAAILTSISTLKGIQYVNSDDEVATLYTDIYAVNNLEAKEKISDNNSGSADGKQMYVFQEMASFGTGYYEYNFKQNSSEVLCTTGNIDYITYGAIRLVKPNNFKMSFVVIDLGDSLLMYNLAQADFFAISVVEKRMRRAFIARADAMYDWFKKEYGLEKTAN